MSRCFPFPPPGYEKARIDNTDLLKKEKQKEKKQKKDKKEREKRDSKEKQDIDRSKDKHKDKKDRKEKRKDKDRDKDKVKSKTPDEKKLEVQPRNGEKLSSNSIPKTVNKDNNSLHLQELAKRIRDGERASGSQMVQNVVPMVVERRVGNQIEEKDKVRNKIDGQRRVNGRNDSRAIEKPSGHQLVSGFDKRVEAITKLEEKKNVEKQMEAKGKRIEPEKNKKLKDKDRGKEEKKKVKEIIEPSKDQLKLNEKFSSVHQVNKDSLDFRNIKLPPESVNLSIASEGNLGKRKELESNGYLLDNGSRPNKLPRITSFKEPNLENGKKLEPLQATVELTNEPRLGNNHRVDNKEQKINGSTASHQPGIGSLKISKTSEQKGENFSKAPHPDTKYLSKILSVPKMEEWCDLDDQEWLFSGTDLQSKSSRGTLTEGTQRQVWAESFRIESADISALPYVIPY